MAIAFQLHRRTLALGRHCFLSTKKSEKSTICPLTYKKEKAKYEKNLN
jgi:hypothetical protein